MTQKILNWRMKSKKEKLNGWMLSLKKQQQQPCSYIRYYRVKGSLELHFFGILIRELKNHKENARNLIS